LALSVPLSRFTPLVGGGSAFYVRQHRDFMRISRFIIGAALAAFVVGCSKQSSSRLPADDRLATKVTLTKKSASSSTSSAAAPVAQAAMTAWQQGDTNTAVSSFLAADWSARPLFPTSSSLSLSEHQFGALPAADRQAKAQDISDQLGVLKRLLAAVTQAGHDAAAKQDVSTARKYFTSLKQCGEALDSPESSAIVKLVGQRLKKNADGYLSNLGQ